MLVYDQLAPRRVSLFYIYVCMRGSQRVTVQVMRLCMIVCILEDSNLMHKAGLGHVESLHVGTLAGLGTYRDAVFDG